MSVLFDAASSSYGLGVTSFSWTHTPVGTPTAVGVRSGNNPNLLPTVTYGGASLGSQALQIVCNFGSNNAWIFGLANPLSGARTVALNWSSWGNGNVMASAVTVTGSDTTTCFSHVSGSNGGNGTGTTATDSGCASGANDLLISCALFYSGTGAVPNIASSGAGQTQDWAGNSQDGFIGLAGSHIAGTGGTVVMTEACTVIGGVPQWGIGAAAFKAAAGAARPLRLNANLDGMSASGGFFANRLAA